MGWVSSNTESSLIHLRRASRLQRPTPYLCDFIANIRCPKALGGSKEEALKIFAKACRKRCGASEKIISGLPRAERQKSRQRRRRYFLTPALLVRDLGCRAVEFCQVNGEFFVVRLSAIAQHA